MSLRPAVEEAAAAGAVEVELEPVEQPATVPVGAATFWAMRWEKGPMTWVKTSLVVSTHSTDSHTPAGLFVLVITCVAGHSNESALFMTCTAQNRGSL